MTRRITFVKKILADGNPCAKCGEVEAKLRDSGTISLIDRVLVADERDASSEGMKLAQRLGVNRAPFFVIEENGREFVHESYLRFMKEITSSPARSTAATDATDEAREILERNPDLDLL